MRTILAIRGNGLRIGEERGREDIRTAVLLWQTVNALSRCKSFNHPHGSTGGIGTLSIVWGDQTSYMNPAMQKHELGR